MSVERGLVVRSVRIIDGAGIAVPADILIEDGKIAAIGGLGLAVPDDAEEVDASDCLAIPGLVNAHTHGHGALAKGQGDRWTLELLLNAGPWLGSGRLLEDKYLSAQLNAVEMVRKGCTAAYDLYVEFPTPTVEGMLAVAKAYSDVGMRATVAPMVADRSLFEAIPGMVDALPDRYRSRVEAVRLAPAAATVEACRRIFRDWPFDRAQIRPALAPTIPLHCSSDFLLACRDLAADFGLGLHTHLAESRLQALAGIQTYGETLTSHLDKMGLLGPDLTAAHCVWLDEEDIQRLADRGCSVAHNPGSNLRLGSGIAPVRKMLDRGVNVGIGTDGSHCSDNQNMFEAMRFASFVSRAVDVEPENWISTDEAMRMATRGSARATGFGESTGALEVGRAADIVLLDLDNINLIPLNNPTNQLVHSEDSSAVKSVMIAGKWVLRNGEFVNIDYARLRRRAEESVERLRAGSADMRRAAEELSRYVSGFCVASYRHPYHVERLCGCQPKGGFAAYSCN